MIEIIYKEEKKKAEGNEQFFRIPNNIRQIGEIRGQQKIYIEDYAYTFLKKISRSTQEGGKAAILLGQYHWAEGSAYLFIRSALQIQEAEVSPEHIVFNDKVWGQVYEDSRKYFPEQEIVGWYVSLPGFNMQINEVLLKTHLNHFAGNDKVLFLVEPGEWEEAFFAYESNQLNRQPGYYIYYEKNEPMQNYMIEMSQNKSIEETEKIPDRAVIDLRRNVKQKNAGEKTERNQVSANQKTKQKTLSNKTAEKKENMETERKSGHLTWTLAGCTVAAALALGITFFNSYQNMNGTVRSLVSDVKQDKEPAAAASASGVLVPEVTKGAEDSLAAVENDKQLESGLIQKDNIQGKGIEEHDSDVQDVTNQNTGEQSGGMDGDSYGTEGTDGNQPDTKDAGGNQPDTKDADGNQPNTKDADTNQTNSAADADSAAETAGQGMTQNAGVKTHEYVIQRGDTLTSISKAQYGTIAKVEEICRLNGISTEDIIYAGQKILLPD